MARTTDRWDFACASVLALLTIVSRLPYRARMLYNWDAVQFALALREYDVAKHQPHPPGYILYVVLGRIADAWLHDAAAAYVLLAVIFSGLTTFAVYYLAHAIYDRATALAAATILAVSPLFWFYGSVGLTYAGEALAGATIAYFSFKSLRGSVGDGWLAAGYLGLAGGIRQSILLLLSPLWLVSMLVGTRTRRALAIGLVILVAAVLTWFLPMIWLTGGWERYLSATVELAQSVVKPTSVGVGPLETTLRMSRYVLESVVVGLGPLVLAVVLVPWYVRRQGWGRREWFLALWCVPPIAYCTLVHFGQAGYVLTFLPALVIFLSRVLLFGLTDVAVLALGPRLRAGFAAAVVIAVVIVNGSFFVNARPMSRDFDTPRSEWERVARDEAYDWIFSRTAAAIREHEAVLRTFVAAIRGLYSAEDTVVITEVGNPRSYPWLRHAMFYLPEYTIYDLRVGDLPFGYYAPKRSSTIAPVPDSEIRVPASTRRLVWFVDHWGPRAPWLAGLTEIEIPYGRFLYALPLGRTPVHYAGYTFVRDEPPRRAARTAR